MSDTDSIAQHVVSNQEFIHNVFKDDVPRCHVAGFAADPYSAPRSVWSGHQYNDIDITPGNQYFTVGVFSQPQRRKEHFIHQRCYVLDDIREKLSVEEAAKLPNPSWVLETSEGSEQWGYIFDTPVSDTDKLYNLTRGLIDSDLVPKGVDPGMASVTRYMRLPEGYNNKPSKLVNGQPFQCRMLTWQPSTTVTIEELAAAFDIDLTIEVKQGEVGLNNLLDDNNPVHRYIKSHGHVDKVQGKYHATCPLVHEHTNKADTGFVVWTHADGGVRFDCKHGSHEDMDTNDWFQELPGLQAEIDRYKVIRAFSGDAPITAAQTVDFSGSPVNIDRTPEVDVDAVPNFFTGGQEPLISESTPETPTAELGLDAVMVGQVANLRRMEPGIDRDRQVSHILKTIDQIDVTTRDHWHAEICSVMNWGSTQRFTAKLKALRAEWYVKGENTQDWSDLLYVGGLNQFFSKRKKLFYTPDAFQNMFCHIDGDARQSALTGGVTKVDVLDYAPKMPEVFEEKGIICGNAWSPDDDELGIEGDCSPWLNHFDCLGWTEHKKHILQWMAYTLVNPDIKINHLMIFGGLEGSGKDFLIQPLEYALKQGYVSISGDQMLGEFDDHLVFKKFMVINEAELGSVADSRAMANKLKPLACAPPNTLPINPKGTKKIWVRNIVNAIMTTNGAVPVRTIGHSRRYFAIWSDLNVRDHEGNMLKDWEVYFEALWDWLRDGGWQYCVWYLRNNVDLSDFSPGVAPPVTQYLKDIKESSMSPMEKTLKALISAEVGPFKQDVLTVMDMVSTIKAAEIGGYGELLEVDAKRANATAVGKALQTMTGIKHFRAQTGGRSIRFWAIRNMPTYQVLDNQRVLNIYNNDKPIIQELLLKLQSGFLQSQ